MNNLRQLKALHAMVMPGSIDRLHIADRHALTLRSYKRNNDAIDVLQAALAEFQAAHDDVLPVEANATLTFSSAHSRTPETFSRAARKSFLRNSLIPFTPSNAGGSTRGLTNSFSALC